MLPGFDVVFFQASPFWNKADKTASTVLSNSDQTASCPQNNGVRSIGSVASGSWYVEIKLDANGNAATIGVANAAHAVSTFPGSDANSTGYNGNTIGSIFNNGASVTGTSPGGYGAGDVIGMHILFGTGVRFTKNGVVVSTGYFTMPTGPLMVMVWQDNLAGTSTFSINLGPTYAMPGGASYWPI